MGLFRIEKECIDRGYRIMNIKTLSRSAIYHFFMILLSFIMVYPLLWMAFSSFKESSLVFENIVSLFPEKWTNAGFVNGWKGFGGISFSVFFSNSFFYAIVSTMGAVISSSLVAYGFARIDFKWKKFWFACMMISIMLPYQVLMIPQYVIFQKLRWINTYSPLIIPQFFGMPFFIFMLIQFIKGIPLEMDEAAIIDGCNKYVIFPRIILPLLTPALVTVVIFSFYWRWNDFLGPLIYLNRPSLYPVSVALKLFSDPNAMTDWSSMFAMATLSLIPVFLIFFIFQRNIVEGISTSGLKG